MSCPNCNQAQMEDGTTTVKFERGGVSFTFKNVPAQICPKCGHETVDESVNDRLSLRAEMLRESGAKVYIREYSA